jgi:ribosomal protein L18
MNKSKQVARIRRARQTRLRMTALQATRLAVFRSNSHIYAQVISGDGSKVLAPQKLTFAHSSRMAVIVQQPNWLVRVSQKKQKPPV